MQEEFIENYMEIYMISLLHYKKIPRVLNPRDLLYDNLIEK